MAFFCLTQLLPTAKYATDSDFASLAIEEQQCEMLKTPDNACKTQGTAFFPFHKAALFMWTVYPPCLLLLGGFGNIATIFVMRRMKDRNSSQHVILISLAVCDFCVLYVVMLRDWLNIVFDVDVRDVNVVLCKVHVWVVYSITCLSAWLLTCVTVQRTLAVTWPHKMRVMCTVRRTWTVVAVVVITAFSLHFHNVIYRGLDEYHSCEGISASYKEFISKVYPWLDMCLSSLFPSVCLIICNVILSLALFKSVSASSVAIQASSNADTTQNNNSRKKAASKTTITILVLSCTFLLLSLPVCIYLIWIKVALENTEGSVALYNLIDLWSTVGFMLLYTNSAINFLLYCFTGTKFRREFLGLLGCVNQNHSAAGKGGTTARASGQISKQHDSMSENTQS
ncbi:uncharacterized protein LOC143283888 [Babylonia areolata]|uniref:uncharacterized protein LOC143283888 n=1 Tax=Babylonia areolata TaxID=304850 RepID=UPI003FD0C94F